MNEKIKHRANNSNDLFEKVCSLETLLKAALRASRKCPLSAARANFLVQLGKNCQEIRNQLLLHTYRWGPYQSKEVCDPKRRIIHKAPFRDRVVHQAIAEVLNPILERHLIYHTYACRTAKGTDAALQTAIKWVKLMPYALRLDFCKYFASVNHQLLISKLTKIITDQNLLKLLNNLIVTFSPGIPIGNLTSQLFANFYLNDIDQFIKRELKVRYYARYMDDLLIFTNSAQESWKIKNAICEYAQNEGLVIHPHKATLHPTHSGVPFLGYRLYAKKRPRLHKRKLRRLKQCLAKSANKSANKTKAKAKAETQTQSKTIGLHHTKRWQSVAGWYGSAKFGLTQKLTQDLGIAEEVKVLQKRQKST